MYSVIVVAGEMGLGLMGVSALEPGLMTRPKP
jgi:hypothetical protein